MAVNHLAVRRCALRRVIAAASLADWTGRRAMRPGRGSARELLPAEERVMSVRWLAAGTVMHNCEIRNA
jgi:hypothetical protein